MPSTIVNSLTRVPNDLSEFGCLPVLSPMMQRTSIITPAIDGMGLSTILGGFLQSVVFYFFVIFSSYGFVTIRWTSLCAVCKCLCPGPQFDGGTMYGSVRVGCFYSGRVGRGLVRRIVGLGRMSGCGGLFKLRAQRPLMDMISLSGTAQ